MSVITVSNLLKTNFIRLTIHNYFLILSNVLEHENLDLISYVITTVKMVLVSQAFIFLSPEVKNKTQLGILQRSQKAGNLLALSMDTERLLP